MRPRLLSFEKAWTEAAFDAIHPENTALPHGVARLEPAKFYDQLLQDVPLEQSIGLRLALWIVALSPIFMIGSFGTIASITPEARTKTLEKIYASPVYAVRQLAMSLKAMASLLYTQSLEVRAAMLAPEKLVVLGRGPSSPKPVTPPGKEIAHEHAAQ